MNFKTVSTILMIVLIGLLVGILIRYYNTPIRTSKTTTELSLLSNHSNTNHTQNPISIHQKSSGEFASENNTDQNETKEAIINENGELNNKEDVTETKVEPKESKTNDKPNTVIIQSEDTMTNREKREILTELDNTLMELLDVVEKVQTVDETRLPTESEVQK